MTDFDKVFDEVRKQLLDSGRESTPIFDKTAETMKPLLVSSEKIGGLKALMLISDKLRKRVALTNRFDSKDFIELMEETRLEVVRERNG
jgi:hypothetical protein